jgi:hypothetical protein
MMLTILIIGAITCWGILFFFSSDFNQTQRFLIFIIAVLLTAWLIQHRLACHKTINQLSGSASDQCTRVA